MLGNPLDAVDALGIFALDGAHRVALVGGQSRPSEKGSKRRQGRGMHNPLERRPVDVIFTNYISKTTAKHRRDSFAKIIVGKRRTKE